MNGEHDDVVIVGDVEFDLLVVPLRFDLKRGGERALECKEDNLQGRVCRSCQIPVAASR